MVRIPGSGMNLRMQMILEARHIFLWIQVVNARWCLPSINHEIPLDAIAWLLNFNTSPVVPAGTRRDKYVSNLIDVKKKLRLAIFWNDERNRYFGLGLS